VENAIFIAMSIVSVSLIAIILLQSRGAGLGGLGGGDFGGGSGFHVRRGLEKLFFNLTIVVSVVFFILALVTVIIAG
jgi:preprotein translocase subunit SecG